MNSSLDKLVKNLSDNSFKKFKETNLPNIEKFFSSLKDCGIGEKEYQRACDIWKVFEIKDLGQFKN